VLIETPHVDRAWRDRFVLELREREVPGPRIGDALVHVESFCADSGRGAEEEFGAADVYARSLFGDDLPEPGPTPLPTGVVVALSVGLLGMLLTFDVAQSWLAGTATELTLSMLVHGALVLAAAVGVTRHVVALVRRPWRGALLLTAVVGVLVGVHVVLADGPSVTLPTAAAAVPALVLLLAPSLWLQRHDRSADVLTAPFTSDADATRANRTWDVLTAWALPLCTLVGTAFQWVIAAAIRAA